MDLHLGCKRLLFYQAWICNVHDDAASTLRRSGSRASKICISLTKLSWLLCVQ